MQRNKKFYRDQAEGLTGSLPGLFCFPAAVCPAVLLQQRCGHPGGSSVGARGHPGGSLNVYYPVQ